MIWKTMGRELRALDPMNNLGFVDDKSCSKSWAIAPNAMNN